jgi:hypothetical protein
MKKSKRTIELTIERSEFVVRRAAPTAAAWCAACGGRVAVAAPEAAARATGLSAEIVYHRLAAGTAHAVATPGGRLLVCLASLRSQDF